jgi:hypothetical protein
MSFRLLLLLANQGWRLGKHHAVLGPLPFTLDRQAFNSLSDVKGGDSGVPAAGQPAGIR